MQKKLFLEQRCKVVSVCTNGRKKMTAANICLRIVFQSSTYVAALPAPEAKTFSSYFCFLDSSQIFIYQKKKVFLIFPSKFCSAKFFFSPPLSFYLGMHQILSILLIQFYIRGSRQKKYYFIQDFRDDGWVLEIFSQF